MKKIFVAIIALMSVVSMNAQNNQMAAMRNVVMGKYGEASITVQESYTPSFEIDGIDKPVKNVILMIGDGMGYNTVNTAMYANGGHLTMTNLRTFGFVKTQSGSHFITDSAASGTAYACGIKTTNGRIGMDADKKAVANIPEKIAPKGIISGVISTDDVNGATPSSFFAHQPERGMTKEIWGDVAGSYLTFLSAGTKKLYDSMTYELITATEKNFTVVYDPKDAKVKSSKRLIYLPESVQYADRGAYLPETTQMAIDYLSARAKNGFFLMVEGARIDKAAHDNNYPLLVKEALDFDKAIEVAVKFAEKNGETLVIISADHETGAVTLADGKPADGYMKGVFASGGHTPVMVPLFAYGPQSRTFAGTQENSDVSNKIVEILTK